MANKRTLKRAIHSICEDLFAEAIAVSLYGAKGQQGNAEAMLFSIVKVEDEFIRRACHPDAAGSVRRRTTRPPPRA